MFDFSKKPNKGKVMATTFIWNIYLPNLIPKRLMFSITLNYNIQL